MRIENVFSIGDNMTKEELFKKYTEMLIDEVNNAREFSKNYEDAYKKGNHRRSSQYATNKRIAESKVRLLELIIHDIQTIVD